MSDTLRPEERYGGFIPDPNTFQTERAVVEKKGMPAWLAWLLGVVTAMCVIAVLISLHLLPFSFFPHSSHSAGAIDTIKIVKQDSIPKPAATPIVEMPLTAGAPCCDNEEEPVKKSPVKVVIKKKVSTVSHDAVFTVQVRATQDEAQAVALKERLAMRGIDSYIENYKDNAGGAWYRVRIGVFVTRHEADLAAQKIRTDNGLDVWVTPR